MWQKLLDLFQIAFKGFLKKYIASAILKAVGSAGGFWTWIVSFAIEKIWKKLRPELKEAAQIKDQEKINEGLNNKYQEDIKNHAPESELIKDESSILNGGRK